MHDFDTDEKDVGVSHVESTLSTVGETNANHEEAPEFKLTWGKFMAMLVRRSHVCSLAMNVLTTSSRSSSDTCRTQ